MAKKTQMLLKTYSLNAVNDGKTDISQVNNFHVAL